MGWTYAFSKLCELESFHGSHTSGIMPDKMSTLQLPRMWEVNERLCIKEVGVDLELFVHAHRHDVDPIIEVSCNINYFLDMTSSGIYVLIICNHDPDHIFSLVPFLRQVKAIVFCWLIHLCNLYFWSSLSINLWYLEYRVTSCESSSSIVSRRSRIPPGSELLVTQEHR